MIYYINQSLDPYFNLALEEVLIKSSSIQEDIFLLWQNHNTIVIGKNQNTMAEINNEKVQSSNVNVVRRLSGGGAVYHDLGNLNFTFITAKKADNVHNYAYFTKPIVKTLQHLGLPAVFSGKNDILVDGKKISGNAQFFYADRILHHGTILFNVDMSVLTTFLKPDLTKIKYKGIKSVQAAVTNIQPLLHPTIDINTFKAKIIEELKTEIPDLKIMAIPENIKTQAIKLREEKYITWEWNYGQSPVFEWENSVFFPDKGKISIGLNIKDGKISALKIWGDFMGTAGTELLSAKLIGLRYLKHEILNQISVAEIKEVFGVKFTVDDFMQVLIK